MNLFQPIAGFIFRQGAKIVASNFVLNPVFNFISRRFVALARDFIIPQIEKAVALFTEWDTNYLPAELDAKIDGHIREAVNWVEGEFTDEAKVRMVLRFLASPDLPARLKNFSVKDESWAWIKANAPAEILELVNNLRKKEAIDTAKELIFEHEGITPRASIIAPKIEAIVSHEREKAIATGEPMKLFEALARESAARKEALK